jgi:phosphoribosylformylglycinamidine synthase
VSGLADACRALGVPVVGGNVSLYNEAPEGPIYPTPIVGMVGKLPDAARTAPSGFAADGDALAFVGPFLPDARGSELSKLRGEPLADSLPEVSLEAFAVAAAVVREAVRAGDVRSAHDVAEGGFAVGVAEGCLLGGRGARLDFGDPAQIGARLELFLFGECPGGWILTGDAAVFEAMSERIAVTIFGQTGGDRLVIENGGIDVSLDELRAAWSDGLAPYFP